MKRVTFRRRPNPQRLLRRATAATELAICLPLLLTVAIGCADFGRYVHRQIAVANAARVAAEYGATHRVTEATLDAWKEKVEDAALRELEALQDYSQSETRVETAIDGFDEGTITVEVETTFHTAIDWPFVPSSVPLFHRVAMRQYR